MLVHTRAFVSRSAREPRLTSSILARFFLLYGFATTTTTTTVAGSHFEEGKWKRLSWSCLVKFTKTVTDTSIFFAIFFCEFSLQVKIVFFFLKLFCCCFLGPKYVCAKVWLLCCAREYFQCGNLLQERKRRKSTGKSQENTTERKSRCWCKSFISK